MRKATPMRPSGKIQKKNLLARKRKQPREEKRGLQRRKEIKKRGIVIRPPVPEPARGTCGKKKGPVQGGGWGGGGGGGGGGGVVGGKRENRRKKSTEGK